MERLQWLRTPAALVRWRRLSQAAFLALFVAVLIRTGAGGSSSGAEAEIRIPAGVTIFVQVDPLAAVTNAVATRSLYRGLLWSLLVLIPTLFLGRFFCGWVCPLGTLHHLASALPSLSKRGRRRIESNRYQNWHSWKYGILVTVLVAAFFGVTLFTVLDPIPLAVRSLALSLLPPHGFRQASAIGLLFVLLLLLNLRITRFWCRALCPLGALLGIAGRWSLLRLVKNSGECGDCNRCLLHCQGGDDPIPSARWRQPECHVCFNCTADCPKGSLRFAFGIETERPAHDNPQRRKILAGVAAGLVAAPLLRGGTAAQARGRSFVRPPGALDERDFLARCIRCGECMAACPTRALQPAWLEGGFEALWTPVLAARTGYCEPACTSCGQACPTGAIWEFTLAEKGWTGDTRGKAIRIGTAFIDRGRCLPWAMATSCIVCEEWCPTSPKAIYLRAADVADAGGNRVRLQQPYVDPERCVGCGACEFACPVGGLPAAYVGRAGESRAGAHPMVLRQRAREARP